MGKPSDGPDISGQTKTNHARSMLPSSCDDGNTDGHVALADQSTGPRSGEWPRERTGPRPGPSGTSDTQAADKSTALGPR